MKASPIAPLVAHLRSRDVRFGIDGDRIKVDAPSGTVTASDRDLLKKNKPDLLDFLRREQRVVNLTIEEFRQAGLQLELTVPWLDETIFFVPTALAAARLGERGVGRGRIWTADELSNIAEIDSPTDIPTIGRLKGRLGLEIISADRDEDSRL